MYTYLMAVPADSENYISHHGIKGQKWGIRRFQNPDGTRTPLGRKREREMDHDELIKSTDPKVLYKNRDKLSDRELQDRLNRLRNEEALKQMANPKKTAKTGKGVAGKVLAKVGEKSAELIAVTAIAAVVGTNSGTELANKLKTGFKAAYETFSKTHPTEADFIDFFKDSWNP